MSASQKVGRKARRRTRGTIDWLPSGAARVRVYAGKDPITGREHYLTEVVPEGHPDAANEAERARTRLLNQVDEQRQPRTNATMNKLLDRHIERADIDRKTKNRYRGLADRHIRPLIGKEQAGRIDAETIESLYAELRRCRLHCDGKPFIEHRTCREHECDDRCPRHACEPLSPATIRTIHYVLSGAYRSAKRWRWVWASPLEFVDAPSPGAPSPRPPSPQEAAQLLNQAWRTSPDWGAMVWLAMVTGSRRGEICAIRWRHLDLEDAHVLHLEKAIGQLGSDLWEKPTKTHQERRIVLDDETVSLLADHWQRCVDRARALGIALSKDAYVFSLEPDGSRPPRPDTATQRYSRLAKKLGIDTHLHALRHYSATELIAGGTDIRTVAGRLGHGSGGATTLRVYAAWVSEADQRAAMNLVKHMPARPKNMDRAERARIEPKAPYERLAADIRGQIQAGELSDGQEAPTQKELISAHGVSTGTANRALGLLRDWGCLTGGGRGVRARVVCPADADEQVAGDGVGNLGEVPPARVEGPEMLQLEVLHLGAKVRTLTTQADLADPSQLHRLLASAARRHGGEGAEVADYELEVRKPGAPDLLTTYVAL